MKKVFTAKDIAELKRSGGALPPDAILTPQAKEALSGGAKISSSAPAPKSAAVSAVGRKEYKIPEKEAIQKLRRSLKNFSFHRKFRH